MYKKVLISLFLASSLYSEKLDNEKFQLLAENIDSKNSVVTATGNVVIFSQSYYLSANKVIYDKQKDSFELFDNVLIIKNNNLQSQSNYAYVDLKNESYTQNPMFLYDRQSNIWTSSRNATKENDVIKLKNSIISSCDCVNPDWSIQVSSASYNIKNKWIHTYNPRLYLGGVPVFYSPYFGFPTDKTRRTGLLIPTMGYSKNDGFIYYQPIYFAPAENYDIEVVPQIRNQRGLGTYTYFRYADSPYSMLKIGLGGFKDKKHYQKENNLKNQKHYGWNLNYERSKLFSNNDAQDGLYADINFMNDIEYRTLENEDEDLSTDKKVESKINYIYNTSKYYGGLYAKYYIDTSKDSNDDVLQELPQLHFHKYSDTVFNRHISYSLDTKFYNYTRKRGLKATIYELSAPISYSHNILDDYLYVKAENRLTLSKYKYGNNSAYDFEDAQLLQNELSLTLGSDLIKTYDNNIHTLNLKAQYSQPKNLKKDGDLFNITNENSELNSFPITQGEKSIDLSLNQSLYNKKTLKQIVNHKISQSILYENDTPKLYNLDNFLKINHDFGSISNKTVYNVKDSEFIEHDTNLNFSYNDFDLNFGHYKSKRTKNSQKEDLESYRVKTSYTISKDYKISYYENYNIQEKVRNKQGVSLNINDICWNLNLNFEKEIVPSTTNDDRAIEQKVVFINLQLKPLGGIKYKHKVDEK